MLLGILKKCMVERHCLLNKKVFEGCFLTRQMAYWDSLNIQKCCINRETTNRRFFVFEKIYIGFSGCTKTVFWYVQKKLYLVVPKYISSCTKICVWLYQNCFLVYMRFSHFCCQTKKQVWHNQKNIVVQQLTMGTFRICYIKELYVPYWVHKMKESQSQCHLQKVTPALPLFGHSAKWPQAEQRGGGNFLQWGKGTQI